ncbi:unnamed protein product [Closterium sp. Yama58-4]|nr:unnamed protein product [Closterium sp. Yama58-4]
MALVMVRIPPSSPFPILSLVPSLHSSFKSRSLSLSSLPFLPFPASPSHASRHEGKDLGVCTMAAAEQQGAGRGEAHGAGDGVRIHAAAPGCSIRINLTMCSTTPPVKRPFLRTHGQASIDGYNVCIFVYGQTGSGKTHTIYSGDQNSGLTLRIMQELFNGLR